VTVKARMFPDGCRHFFAQVRSAVRVRRRFGGLGPDATYPVVEAGCEFDDCSRIAVGRHVRFLRGAVVLAQGGTIQLGDDSVVARYAVVQATGGRIRIGSRVAVGDFCSLYGQGGLDIGDDVLIASGVRIVPNRHTFEQPGKAIAKQTDVSRGIAIGDRAWIGTNAVILDGVRVGADAVVGAGAVVNHHVKSGEIVAGVPARRIRFRPGYDELDGPVDADSPCAADDREVGVQGSR
jgi:acetyltransferase-like isoleucine patch superfamily enzyme